MVQTSDGGYAMAGYTTAFSGTMDFWLVKTDSSGNVEWSKAYGGSGWDEAMSVVQTKDGGYALAGYSDSYGYVIFSFLLVKTDSSGNLEWSRTYGGIHNGYAYDDRASSVIQTSDGGYAIAGRAFSASAGLSDFWLIKTNSLGYAVWNHTYGGSDVDEANSVVQTSDGGYALAGYTASYGAGGYDYWLVRTDSFGNEQWNQTYGGPNADLARTVVQTSDGGFVVCGSSTSFGAGQYDAWVVKTDSSGNMEWNQTYGGTNYDFGSSIVQTSEGGYAIGGCTYSDSNNYDFWFIKTNSFGEEQCSKTYGGTSEDEMNALVQTKDGGYALAGYTLSYGAGHADFWLIKTAAISVNDYLTIQAAINHASPGDLIKVAAGTYDENILVDKSVSLIGENNQNTLINGDGTGNTVSVTADGVLISGFGITGSGSTDQASAVFLDNVENAKVTNNVISDNEGYGVFIMLGTNNLVSHNTLDYNGWVTDAAGIRVDGEASSAVIANNTINDNFMGIFLNDANNVVVGNNSLAGDYQYGISVQGNCNNALLNNNTISGGSFGVFFDDSFGSTIEKNSITATGSAGVSVQGGSSFLEIRDNDISNNWNDGVDIGASSSHNNIIDNVLNNNGQVVSPSISVDNVENFIGIAQFGIGVKLESASNNVISGNSLQNNHWVGIGLWSSYGNTILGNNVSNNEFGLYFVSSDGNTVYHNQFVNNQVQAYVNGDGNVWDNGYPSGGNYWSDYTGKDANHDGIGDTPYNIDALNVDNYPLFPSNIVAQAFGTQTVSDGSVTVDQSAETGVSVGVDDPSIPDGASLTVKTIDYGANLPPGTTASISVGGNYYDVQVIPSSGLPMDTVVSVNITNPAFNENSQIMFWNGESWIPVDTQFYAPSTLCATFTLSQLQGTPLFVTPEYSLGALLATIACFAAVGIFRNRKKINLHLPLT